MLVLKGKKKKKNRKYELNFIPFIVLFLEDVIKQKTANIAKIKPKKLYIFFTSI